MTAIANIPIELRDGSLRYDPGLPAPAAIPAGYRRDDADPWRFVLTVKPAPCESRSSRPCVFGRRRRWFCARRDVYVNPAACCRCQGVLDSLS